MKLSVVLLLIDISCDTVRGASSSSMFTSIKMNPNSKYGYPSSSGSNKVRTRARTRMNSRFLRTFPATEVLEYARKAAQFRDPFPPPPKKYFEDSYGPYGGHHHHNHHKHMNSVLPPSQHALNHMHFYEQQPPMRARFEAGNSPIFYIRLPPSPYVFMPGLGYVSPHPYNNPTAPVGMPGPSKS